MSKQTAKRTAPPHYDDAFKKGAIQMVTEQKLPIKQVAAELGICIDTLRSWLRKSGLNPVSENHNNNISKKIHDLETQIRDLNKKLAHKDEVIDTLKKSIGIISNH
ncbi:MAG: hypothetical protein H6Q73_3546 [Firmicutes bacterium]|nr:hypothetical protein [Bacillota bacterium]